MGTSGQQSGKDRELVRLSKFLSLVLRHRPEAIGIELDRAGWVEIETLLTQCDKRGRRISRSLLEEVVRTNNKHRFAISDDGSLIRASQGHSIAVHLGYEPRVPPEVLYHGTVSGRLKAIQSQGLRKMKRHHVHLSADATTASDVGGRRGIAVVLSVQSRMMHCAGHVFYLSENGVWLTEHVPAAYLGLAEVEEHPVHKDN
jgi:putative RNA 2'-phosphotransferase